MRRFFLSGQTTCAMLLGAGLLLRAQAALTRSEPAQQASLEAPRARPAELLGERAPRIARASNSSIEQRTPADSHLRKGYAHASERHQLRKCGVALASHNFRCG